jgi:nucleoside-diphosphate-sugar epimerase
MDVEIGHLPYTDKLKIEGLENLAGKRVFITGITAPVGREVAGLLSSEKVSVSGLVRDRKRAADLVGRADLLEGICENLDSYREKLQASAFVIHIAGMQLAPWIIRASAGHTHLERILFVSSARVLYPDHMLSRWEASQKREMLEREGEVSSSLLPWTILRPTLIFSSRDRSISKVTKYMTNKRFFPLPGSGNAVKQPVSARDLALSIVRALLSPAAYQKIYNIPGEEITVREMLDTISLELGKRVTYIRMPRFPLAVLMKGLEIAGFERRARSLKSLLRWYRDIRFSGEPAREDFGHSPRSFRENMREQIAGEVR